MVRFWIIQLVVGLVVCGGICGGSHATSNTLRAAQILFRHGDRTPDSNFPGMPDQEALWPNGFYQLTQRGVQQLRGLGENLRERYNGFINTTYSKKELFVRSSDTDRTLMSASSLISGLYPTPPGSSGSPESTNTVEEGGLAWVWPIPVHTRPDSMDHELSAVDECPLFDQLWAETLEAATPMILQQSSAIINILRAQSNVEPLNPMTLLKMADALMCMDYHPELDFTTPVWVTPDLSDWLYKYRDGFSNYIRLTEQMKYLASGPLLGLLTEPFQKITRGETVDVHKLYLYSTHDTVIAQLMQSLDIWNGRNPAYASALLFELHETAPGDFVVQVYFKNDTVHNTTSPPMQLTLPGCEASCPLEQFVELTAAITYTGGSLEEWQNICAVNTDNTTSGPELPSAGASLTHVMIGLLLFLCAILGIGLLIHVHKENKKRADYEII